MGEKKKLGQRVDREVLDLEENHMSVKISTARLKISFPWSPSDHNLWLLAYLVSDYFTLLPLSHVYNSMKTNCIRLFDVLEILHTEAVKSHQGK